MRTVQLLVDDALFERLEAAAASQGQDVNRYAVAALERVLLNHEHHEDQEDDLSDLTEEDHAAMREGYQRGLKASDEGRYRSIEEVIADKRKRFGLNL